MCSYLDWTGKAIVNHLRFCGRHCCGLYCVYSIICVQFYVLWDVSSDWGKNILIMLCLWPFYFGDILLNVLQTYKISFKKKACTLPFSSIDAMLPFLFTYVSTAVLFGKLVLVFTSYNCCSCTSSQPHVVCILNPFSATGSDKKLWARVFVPSSVLKFKTLLHRVTSLLLVKVNTDCFLLFTLKFPEAPVSHD